jgi:tripartite-type tricarboxylate transporter receptor subunit TctC
MVLKPHPAPSGVRRRWLKTGAAATWVWALPVSARASSVWPQKAVRILVGFPAGSTPDMAARVLAEGLSQAWGQPVVVEAKTGAAGNLAADAVAKAKDDHTLGVVINGNLTSAKALYPQLPFDPQRDLWPVSLLATAPMALVASPEVPSGKLWVQALRDGGSRHSYGSVGLGSLGHLGFEIIQNAIGGSAAVHVPYASNPAIINAMLGAQIQWAIMPAVLAEPHARHRTLQILGLTGPRSPMVPAIPSVQESGVRIDPIEAWVALVTPSGQSHLSRDRLTQDVPALLSQPDVLHHLNRLGWQGVGSSGATLSQRVQQETRLFEHIIQTRGIRLAG